MSLRVPNYGCIVIIWVVISAGPALAANVFTYLDQDRQVDATATVTGGSPQTQMQQASDFGPFHGDVTASAGTSPTTASAQATQDTTLDSAEITSTSTLLLTCSSGTSAQATSTCNVSFAVASDTDFSVFGFGTGPFPFQSAATTLNLSLLTIDGTTNLFPPIQVSLANDPLPFNESGMLAVGSYTLKITETANANGTNGNGSYNVRLSGAPAHLVPLPAAAPAALATLLALAVVRQSRLLRRAFVDRVLIHQHTAHRVGRTRRGVAADAVDSCGDQAGA
jgi:hypothetical protein